MPQGSKSSLDSLLELYSGGGTTGLQGVNAFLKDKAPGMLESLVPNKGDGLPGFEDIYSNFSNVVQRDLDKRLAELRESYGTRGAAYSGSAARQAARARTEATERIIGGASALRTARAGELQGLGSLALGAAGQGLAERQSAVNLMLADWLKQTTTPESLAALANYALGYGSSGQPTTLVY